MLKYKSKQKTKMQNGKTGCKMSETIELLVGEG